MITFYLLNIHFGGHVVDRKIKQIIRKIFVFNILRIILSAHEGTRTPTSLDTRS